MKDILNNLEIARNAALEAGNMLLNSKADLNKEKISSGKDIKLKADIEAEKFIKEYLLSKSNQPPAKSLRNSKSTDCCARALLESQVNNSEPVLSDGP